MEVSVFNIKNTQGTWCLTEFPLDAKSPASRDSVPGWLLRAVKSVKVRVPEQSDADLARCAEQDPLPPECCKGDHLTVLI